MQDKILNRVSFDLLLQQVFQIKIFPKFVPFLVAAAIFFMTTPSIPLCSSLGEELTKLNSSQLSVIFLSGFSSGGLPARSISYDVTGNGGREDIHNEKINKQLK